MHKKQGKVIISSGRKLGGLEAFAQGLQSGFQELGYDVVIVRGLVELLSHWNDLRNPQVIKIFSTWAGFFTPFSTNYCTVAHGFPRADAQGLIKVILIIASLRHAAKNGRLISVSNYTAVHLQSIFNTSVNSTIANPVNTLFLQPWTRGKRTPSFIFVGRLHPVKRLAPMLEGLSVLHRRGKVFRVGIIGEGSCQEEILRFKDHLPHFEFFGPLSQDKIREHLLNSDVFFSGCATEALGIAYIEALACGCKVVMPASGGGIEIALDQLEKAVFLAPISLEAETLADVFEKAMEAPETYVDVSKFNSKNVANNYLTWFSHRSPTTYTRISPISPNPAQ